MSEFNLNSPFLTLTFDTIPKHWRAITVAWTAFWLAVSAALVYAYAVVLPSYVGFETALLVGIGIVALASGGDA